MCDVIKIHIKRRIATRSGKGNQPLNIKTALEQPILKLGYSNFSFYLILLLVASLLLDVFFTSHMTLSSDSNFNFVKLFFNPRQPQTATACNGHKSTYLLNK